MTTDPNRLWAMSLAVAVLGVTALWVGLRLLTWRDGSGA